MSWKLKRTRQCAKCPWKTSVDPYDIPNYSRDQHLDLDGTITDPDDPVSSYLGPERRAMSCHEHESAEGVHCIGWLVNQLGSGNNIGLRLAMMNCENADRIRLDGEQHERFEDTIPEERET